ncbi:MAG: hypothetical protein AUJ98_09320 [Bacteroidetes bacterium CG2_30_33_31]|nr:MAG: hypothetical protein AUJ98_09320 [Bacteroidetes bacterium CG2_30_33_31]
MVSRFFALIIILTFSFSLKSQVLKNEYFQQKVYYNIDVQLDDIKHILNAKETIVYKNNSPTELNFLWLHLWPNAYKNENTALCNQLVRNENADLYYAADSSKGFIDSLDFWVDGKQIKWQFDHENIDICKLILNEPIKPGDSISISTPFRVKIPSSEFSRLGHDGQSYAISQWYPKPAVFDLKGWHQMPYLNQGEFYSEIGNFDVTINLNEKYIVGASGNLLDEENQKNLNNNLKSLHYQLNDVHDFAWFADKNFISKHKTIILESGKKVVLTTLFLFEHADAWQEALRYMEQGVKFYSHNVGEYPFETCTAVDGNLAAGGGMEYPTITIIGGSSSKYEIETTIVHEIGHNWFYGILGFNERDYPWMDEGINTFYQSLYEQTYFADKSIIELYSGRDMESLRKLKLDYMSMYYFSYLFMARKNLDQPLSLTSDEFSSINYGTSVYYKSALLFRYLRNYIGPDKFEELMKSFFQEWKFKHPQPEDLANFFESNSSKDVKWFFDDILLTNNKIDYSISKVKTESDSLIITIRNHGDVKSPFSISSVNKDNLVSKTLWFDGFDNKGIIKFPAGDFNKIKIDAFEQMPDINRKNNWAKVHGIFKTSNPKKLKILYSIPFHDIDAMYIMPVIGRNNYNGFMLGVALYNDPAFERNWEYQIVPMYSFNSKNINGEVGIYRNFYTKGIIRKLSIGASGRKYDYDFINVSSSYNLPNTINFVKMNPELNIYFKKPNNISSIKSKLTYRFSVINKQELSYGNDPVPPYIPYIIQHIINMNVLSYKFENSRVINPFGLNMEFQINKEIVKAWIGADYKFNYNKIKSLDLHFFAGNIFFHVQNPTIDYSFKLSNWSGSDDYLFDYTYLGRSELIGSGIKSAQMTPADGGFAIDAIIGRSWSWLSAINVKSSIPFTNLIRFYANAGISYQNVRMENKLLYEAGLYLNVVPKYFEIYFPLLLSADIKQVQSLNNYNFFEQRIRFVLRLDMINPFKILREIEL